ncbi:GTP pyrophosphokinase [Leucobacter sp. USHLN153]|uniref:GTP pyrophosphokinase n=1 Tax=Leucobacter sp. USHLN153 TaxID=3081268 RepID=UPI00301A622E
MSIPAIPAFDQRAGEEPEGDEITISASALRSLGDQMQRFLLEYRFAMEEVETKLAILREEFLHMHEYNPIEHVSSRVKSIDSLVAKLERRGIGTDFDVIRKEIYDIAGVRVTCAFIRDVYRLFDLLTQQDDITVLEVEDYIETPKPNGYKSLHTIISVPVYLSTGRVDVPVEVQFRTIAMDFWASLEHKIYYKYDRQVPLSMIRELKHAAETAAELDTRMERLHVQMHGEPETHTAPLELREVSPRIHRA